MDAMHRADRVDDRPPVQMVTATVGPLTTAGATHDKFGCLKLSGWFVVGGVGTFFCLYAFHLIATWSSAMAPGATGKLGEVPAKAAACDIYCAMKAATWANVSEDEAQILNTSDPQFALDILTHRFQQIYPPTGTSLPEPPTFLKHSATGQDTSASPSDKDKTKEKKSPRMEALDRLQKKATDVMAEMKAMGQNPESKAKNAKINELSNEVQMAQEIVGELKKRKPWAVDMTLDDLGKACTATLRAVGAETCDETPGVATGFLRAIANGTDHKQNVSSGAVPLSVWPVQPKFPGVRTLCAHNGIYMIDGFLSGDEAEYLVNQAQKPKPQSITDLASQMPPTPEEAADGQSNMDDSPGPGSVLQLSMSSTGNASNHQRVQKEGHGGVPPEQPKPKCRPSGKVQDDKSWTQVMEPLFQDKGHDLKKCRKAGFAGLIGHTSSCPPPGMVIENLIGKASAAMTSSPRHLMPFQLLKFSEGDFDADHYLNIGPGVNRSNAQLLSMLVFLNDVKGGGAVYFPSLDMRVKPVKGSALIFPPMLMNLTINPNSKFAHEEVKSGDKWVLSTGIYLGRFEDLPLDSCAREVLTPPLGFFPRGGMGLAASMGPPPDNDQGSGQGPGNDDNKSGDGVESVGSDDGQNDAGDSDRPGDSGDDPNARSSA